MYTIICVYILYKLLSIYLSSICVLYSPNLHLDWPHFTFSPVASGFLIGHHKSRGRRREDWEVSVRANKS